MRMKSVVIFGAGIAGLSAAHELAQLGYSVSVYEAADQPGGFFRSARLEEDNACMHPLFKTDLTFKSLSDWHLMKRLNFPERGLPWSSVTPNSI